jgi:hypothetical protein
MQIMEFVRGHSVYRAGETAGFTPRQAAFLRSIGVAKPADASAEEPRPAPQPPADQPQQALSDRVVTKPVRHAVTRGHRS